MYICSTKEDNIKPTILALLLVRLPIKREKKALETNFCPFLTLLLLLFFKNKEERLHSLQIRYFFISGPPKR